MSSYPAGVDQALDVIVEGKYDAVSRTIYVQSALQKT